MEASINYSEKLYKIDCSGYIEKKNGLSYLSWAFAWTEVLKIDHLAVWNATEFNGLPCAFLPDSSAMVQVMVTIKGHTKQCWLPVMDHRNKAIKNPDAFAINTAIVRCLVKTIALHGLGLFIYAGEDLPEDGNKPEPFDLLAALDAVEAAQDVKQLELVWKARSAQAKAANDKPSYDALAAAVKEKKETFK